jgi:hypothetical protein
MYGAEGGRSQDEAMADEALHARRIYTMGDGSAACGRLCSAITRSRRRWRQQILVMQPPGTDRARAIESMRRKTPSPHAGKVFTANGGGAMATGCAGGGAVQQHLQPPRQQGQPVALKSL